jgi:ankyrin repeat protein
MPVLRSNQLVKMAVSFYWSISTYRAMIRAGPLMELRYNQDRKIQSERYQQIGLGLILSIYLPQCLRSSLGLTLFNFQLMMTMQTGYSLKCRLDFPKTVSPDAEIFRSVRAGIIEDVKRLLSHRKASAKDTTIFGTSLSYSASKSENIELVRLLIQEGADVNAQDEDSDSPLHGAMAISDNYDIARILIENGAELSGKNVDGKTPFHNIFNHTISLVLMRDDLIEHMLPDSEGMSITHYLAWSSRSTPEVFQRGHLFDDADLLSADNLGRTCLHFAASRGNLRVLSYLTRQASLEDVEKKDIQGRTPLHYAAGSSRAAGVIDVLVGKGCNVYAVDNTGRTALHWAARRCNFEAVKKLIAIVGEGPCSRLIQTDEGLLRKCAKRQHPLCINV